MTPERGGRGKSHFTSEAQRAYNSRERSGYQAYVQVNGPVRGGQKAFRKLLKARGWAVPSHGRFRPPSKKRQQAERAFVAEGLGRPERAEADSFKAIYG